MVFEIGKCYEHNSGSQMKIVGKCNTTIYGECLIGENANGNLEPIGNTEEHAINFFEITEEKWLSNFK